MAVLANLGGSDGMAKPGNELQSYMIDSLIQGVTQQSPWDRRDTQCDSQFDCINSPVNGVEARPGCEYQNIIAGDHSAAFCYEIFRGDTEHYLVVIDTVAQGDGHRLHVYDLNTGAMCTVTYSASESYFNCVANPPSISLVASTLQDFTFIGNREVNTAMSGTQVSPPARNEGVIYFRAGAYLTTFQVAITYQGKVYTWTYQTPDNSVAGNAAYIDTSKLAATFFRSFTGIDPVHTPSGTIIQGPNQTVTLGIGQAEAATIGIGTGLVTASKHGLVQHSKFRFATTGSLPTGVATGTDYWVLAGFTDDTFTFAASDGGAAIVPSGSQSGVHSIVPTLGIPGIVHSTAHGLPVGQAFNVTTTGSLPAGMIAGQTYYILNTEYTVDQFTFSLAPGGVPIVLTGTQSGVHTLHPQIPDSVVAGVGPNDRGGTATGQIGAITLTSLGFTVKLNGSVILIHRADATPFTIDTGDGVGDTYLIGCKDTVQNFALLPRSCFQGFTIKVVGSNQNANDDYWTQFKGADGSTGFWEEVVAPGTPLTFDPTTMPLALVNTGVNTFTLQEPPWQNRVAGDGIVSALDPSFIGKPLQDIAFDHGRLLLMAEGSGVWSRAKNVFVFFPDTAQTALDTDPIDAIPGGGRTIALLRRVVQAGNVTMLWAEKIQFVADSGVNTFRQDSVELPPSTYYEFQPKVLPRAVGQSVYFVTETGAWATIRDLSFQQQTPIGAVDVTAHVKKYIPAGARWLVASDTLGYLFATTLGAPNKVFIYNYLLGTSSRLQSAWSAWRLPASSTILFSGISLNYLTLLVQRPDGAAIVRVDLTVDLVDTDTGATYYTRMDFRVNETKCTFSYDAPSNTTTVTLPYQLPECTGWTPSSPTPCPILVVARGGGVKARGNSLIVTGFASTNQVKVTGDIRTEKFYAGFRIRSERTQSTLYLKTTKGLVPHDSLMVKHAKINLDQTGYSRAEIAYQNGDLFADQVFRPVEYGAGDVRFGQVPLEGGTFKVSIDADWDKYSFTLVNDSFLPSRWVSMEYNFLVGFGQAKPSPYGQSVPSYFAQGGTAGPSNNF